MGKSGLFAIALLLGLITAGCGGGDDRPANISVGGDSGVGGFGGGGSGGTGGTTCEPIPGKGAQVSGDSVVIYDPLFKFGDGFPPFMGQAEIKAEGDPCGSTTTTYDATSGQGWQLDDVWKSGNTWVRAYQLETSSEPVYPTLVAVNTAADISVGTNFGFVRSTDVDKIYADTGVTRDPTRATAIVQLIDLKYGDPVAGGTVSIALAESQAAYPSGASWQLGVAGSATDPSGLMAFLNVESKAFPGLSTSVTAITGSMKANYNIALEDGAVTVAWIGVGF